MYKNANTLFTAKKIIHIAESTSTNIFLSRLNTEKKLPSGTVVIANHQIKGKGQRGNVWESAKGENVTLSLLFHPLFLPPKKQFFLNIIISLAIQNTLSHFIDENVYIKWPNDIYVSGKKIAGILIENTIFKHHIINSIIGIGVNINQSHFACKKAISLFQILGQKISIQAVLQRLFLACEKYYYQLEDEKIKEIKSRYYQFLYKWNEWSYFSLPSHPNGVFKGRITKVLDNGFLCVETAKRKEFFDIKGITML